VASRHLARCKRGARAGRATDNHAAARKPNSSANARQPALDNPKQDQHSQRNQCRTRLPAALNNHNTRANARRTILGNNWHLKTANSGAGGPGGGIGSVAAGGSGPSSERCGSSKTKSPAGQAARARSSDKTSPAAKPAGQCSERQTAQSGTTDNDDTTSTGTRQEGNPKNSHRDKPGQDQQ
jgi:hypothetical protein